MSIFSSMAPSAALAVASGATGVLILYASWRRLLQPKWLVVTSGWACIVASVYLWLAAAGSEIGPVIALLQLSLVALAIVLSNRHIRSNRSRAQDDAPLNRPAFPALLRHGAIFMLAVPVGACASFFGVLATSALLPWAEVGRLTFVVLAVPVVWGLASYWACADPRLLRPATGLLAGTAVSVAILYT